MDKLFWYLLEEALDHKKAQQFYMPKKPACANLEIKI